MKVLLAVDGSDASMSAVAATAALSLPTGSRVEVVSVVPDTFAPADSVWPNVVRIDPPTDRDRILEDVARRLSDIADRVNVGDRHVEIRVLEGRPATEIVTEAGRFAADLIVMGARGLSTVRRLLVGSVSSEVVDHAPCPVLVARREAVGRVMVATDGTPGADAAIEYVAQSGLFDTAEIRLISVGGGTAWWTGFSPVDGAAAIEIYDDAVSIAERQARQHVVAAAERLAKLNVADTAALADGDVVSKLLEQAATWRTDLIVLGARDMGAAHRWLVGSVSRSILHLADASVLIVRLRASTIPERKAETAVAV